MSASVNSTASSSSTTEERDVNAGRRMLKYALSSLAWGLSVAAAWSCSTVVMAVICFIIIGIVLAILAQLVYGYCVWFAVSSESFATVGSVATRTADRISSLFTRKAAV